MLPPWYPAWHIVSPTGVIHVVRDEAALKTLAEQEPELVVRRENLLVRLHVVDPKNKKRLEGLPVHQKHWQLLQRVVWLQRVDDSTVLLPIIGHRRGRLVLCGQLLCTTKASAGLSTGLSTTWWTVHCPPWTVHRGQ